MSGFFIVVASIYLPVNGCWFMAFAFYLDVRPNKERSWTQFLYMQVHLVYHEETSTVKRAELLSQQQNLDNLIHEHFHAYAFIGVFGVFMIGWTMWELFKFWGGIKVSSFLTEELFRNKKVRCLIKHRCTLSTVFCSLFWYKDRKHNISIIISICLSWTLQLDCFCTRGKLALL